MSAPTTAGGTAAPAAGPGRSLRAALGGHANSFGFLRLVFAAAVIFDHAFPLGGWGEAPFLRWTRDQQSLGGVAVLGFFAISGYLITRSGLRGDAVQFMWRRFLRIYPGYWAALIVGAAAVGPIFWVAEGNDLRDYLIPGPGGPLHYILGNWTLIIRQYGINDVFVETTPFGLAGNGGPISGSIWTLQYEWMCYLIVAVLLAFGILLRAKVLVPVLTGFFFLAQALYQISPDGVGELFPSFFDPWRFNFGLIFFIGACFALYGDRVPFDDRLGVFAGVFSAVTLAIGGFNTLGYIAFAYFVLYLAARLPRRLHVVGQRNDYSYGIYLYGWVVQQILAYLAVPQWGYLPFVLLSLVGAAGLAWLSWHGVEKQAMKLKDRGPGRGWRLWWDRLRGRREPVAATADAEPATSEPAKPEPAKPEAAGS